MGFCHFSNKNPFFLDYLALSPQIFYFLISKGYSAQVISSLKLKVVLPFAALFENYIVVDSIMMMSYI